MSKKVFKCELSEKSIDNLIKELDRYKARLPEKLITLREKVGAKLQELVEAGFASSIADESIKFGTKSADVTVGVTSSGSITVVYTIGEDAVWCEFGAGVYYNGSAGSSPHPKGAELGFTIGGYGKGQGKKNTWAFKNDLWGRTWTHGVPASMPMYNALLKTMDEVAEIAREVFAND